MNDITTKKDINSIKIQLKNINIFINDINDQNKKINNKLNLIKCNFDVKLNNIKRENKVNLEKNEITCVYDKQDNEINLLYDYSLETKTWSDEEKKAYIEAKENINEKNIDIYINNKKIKFNYSNF